MLRGNGRPGGSDQQSREMDRSVLAVAPENELRFQASQCPTEGHGSPFRMKRVHYKHSPWPNTLAKLCMAWQGLHIKFTHAQLRILVQTSQYE